MTLKLLASLAILFSVSTPTIYAQTAPTPASIPAEDDGMEMLGGVAAIVNDDVISISDVGERARLLIVTMGLQPSAESFQQALPRALDQLINERLQLQKAEEFEVTISDDEIRQSIEGIARQNRTTIPGLYDSLEASGVNPKSLEEQTRADIAWRRVMGGLYGSRIRISKGQIDSMLERMTESADETRLSLSEIFLYAPDEEGKQRALQAANVIIQQLREGAPFQAAAQQFSNSPTAASGGDMGWVAPDTLPANVSDALLAATPPALTSPIVVDDGVYIYAVKDKQEGGQGQADVAMQQVLATNGDRVTLSTFLEGEDISCSSLKTTADSNDNIVHGDLGRVPETALTDEVRAAISPVPDGGHTDIIDTPNGPAALFVCDRGIMGLQLPDEDSIEDRLYNQQITMMSERALRDLKREATIIRR